MITYLRATLTPYSGPFRYENFDKDSKDPTKKAAERRDMSPESWKRHKKDLKLERREKIKDKIPKHVKKRKEKLGKERKGKK